MEQGLSNVKYVSDGNTDTFGIPFPYLSKNDLIVTIDGEVILPVSFPTEGQVVVPDTPPTGSIVEISRHTSLESLVDFKNITILNAETLNTNSKQLLYLIQEMKHASSLNANAFSSSIAQLLSLNQELKETFLKQLSDLEQELGKAFSNLTGFEKSTLFLNPDMSAEEINEAIENLPDGETVVFKEGTYNLEETLSISNKKDLTFVGDGEVLLRKDDIYSILDLEGSENIQIQKINMSNVWVEYNHVITFKSQYESTQKCFNVKISNCNIIGNIIVENMENFLLEKCDVDGAIRIMSKNVEILDCLFTNAFYGYGGTDTLTVKNVDILSNGIQIYMSSDDKKANISNVKAVGRSHFAGKEIEIYNSLFEDYVYITGDDIQINSCEFLYDGEEEENQFSLYASNMKITDSIIHASKSFIDGDRGKGNGLIKNTILKGFMETYGEGFDIINSEILGGLKHGGKNSKIIGNLIKSEIEHINDWDYDASLWLLTNNITVQNNEIENTVGIGFSSSYGAFVTNNEISGFKIGVKATGDMKIMGNNIKSNNGFGLKYIGSGLIMSNNKIDSLNGLDIQGDDISFSNNIIKSEHSGVVLDGGYKGVFSENIVECAGIGFHIKENQWGSFENATISNNQITESNIGIFIIGENHIISNNNIASDNIGLHSDKATKCSITHNIVNSIVDDSGSETDPKEGNYYLGNRTESFELLADEGYTNIAIVGENLVES